jgi:hypothetical protein
MKKSLLICAIAIFALSACKKENTGDVNYTPQTDSKKIEALILDFKDKLDNHLKDGTTYAADSAVWYVEGLLNYEQANNSHNFNGLEFYKDSVLLNATNGEIPILELNDAYAYFDGVIASILEQANDPLLNIDLIDVSISETGLKDGSVEMGVMISTGRGTSINYTLFGGTDYWYWGNDLGACDPLNPSNVVTDAAELLEYKFNHPISVGQSGWFSSIDSVIVMGDEYPDPNNPGPYCEAMIFFYMPPFNPPDDPCLDYEELNYYLSKFDYIKADNQPYDKTFKSVYVGESMYPWGVENFWHYYTLYYGVLSENPD